MVPLIFWPRDQGPAARDRDRARNQLILYDFTFCDLLIANLTARFPVQELRLVVRLTEDKESVAWYVGVIHNVISNCV